ncbi:hypothetical protein LXL04_033861 [Taraxacum kok-saghyz]
MIVFRFSLSQCRFQRKCLIVQLVIRLFVIRLLEMIICADFCSGGTAAYIDSQSRVRRPSGTSQHNGLGDDNERAGLDKSVIKKSRQKTGLKSLQVLAGILLSHMGKLGAKDLLAFLATVVLRTAVSNRLAKVRGFVFRAAFLRRVPTFVQLII